MRIKGAKRRTSLRKVPFIAGAILVIAALILPFTNLWSGESIEGFPYCDAETIIEKSDAIHFEGVHTHFTHGETQSNEEARSGGFSSKVVNPTEFGMAVESYPVEAGATYEISVWRKSAAQKGFLVVDGSWKFYKSIDSPTEFEASGWEQLKVTLTVPTGITDGKLKAYAWNPTEYPAYFDDMLVRKISKTSRFAYPKFDSDSLEKVNLLIGDKGMDKLTEKRKAAMKLGILVAGDDDWVNVKMQAGKKEYKGELRLKGDWTDHLKGDKWSFRVSLNPGFSWNRMVTFSFQQPGARWFLHEWVYHKFLLSEGLLTTRYDFVNLEINHQNRGIYAWEEHFEKQLIEYNQRREGPILKFVEDGFWEVMLVETNTPAGIEAAIPIVESANIAAFKMGKIQKDSALTKQFEIAQDLMTQYRMGAKAARDVFDMDKMARYFAIVDVFRAHHGFVWHNQRLYFNPVLQKLEPIGFDGYTESGPLDWIHRPFIGQSRNPKYFTDSYWHYMFDRFFEDEDFVEKYIEYLYLYSNKAFIERFLEGMSPEIKKREDLLQKEYRSYRYDWNMVTASAHKIRQLMLPRPNSSLKTHLKGASGNNYQYQVFNFHCLPIRPLGIGTEEGKILAKFETDTLLPPYRNGGAPEYETFISSRKGNHIVFEIPGLDSIFSAPIQNWAPAGGTPPSQELFEGAEAESNDFYTVSENQIRFFPKAMTVRGNIIIPAGYEVNFPAGTKLDLVKGARFISKSPVFMRGSEENPVTITSSDKTGGGFTVLQADQKSFLSHVVFDNLNTLSYKSWVLTGAVTFYESEVDIDHCSFVNNHCEDALNIVRGSFRLSNSYVANTAFDGFDCDFCTGQVVKSHFYRTGNDGLDFSGSSILVKDVLIEETGDKGVSVGEESTVTLERVEIINLGLGMASKDLSVLTARGLKLKNLKQGMAAYQKKPEYGGATIIIESYAADGVEELYAIQNGSLLKIDGKEIKGKR